MSSTLMALIHSSLLQQQTKQASQPVSKKECQTFPSSLGHERRTSTDVTTLARIGSAVETQGFVAQLPTLLKQLVEIAAEIARTDGLLKEAEQSAPQGAEAQKWHQVSCRALRWSRDALVDQQSSTLARMKELVQDSSLRAGVVQAEPVPKPAPKTSWLNVDAPAFCPALKEGAAARVSEEHQPLKQRLSGAEHVGSLKEDLEKLRCYDRECCILVRKIKQLGLQSPAKLREHFSLYGELAEVLVSHSFEKPSAKRANGRVRPAALGFVILRTPAAAQAILAAGEEHMVGSGADAVMVAVERYEPSYAELGFES